MFAEPASTQVNGRSGSIDKRDSLRPRPLIRRDRLISSAAEPAGQSVGGMPVEVVPRAVVAAGGAGVCVAGEVLHVAERNTGIQGGGDLAYLPWIRSIAWSGRIFRAEAREVRERRGERRCSRSSAAVAVLRCVPVGVGAWCVVLPGCYRLVSLITRRRLSRAAVSSSSSSSTRRWAVSAWAVRASRSARNWRFAASNAATRAMSSARSGCSISAPSCSRVVPGVCRDLFVVGGSRVERRRGRCAGRRL